MSHTMGTVFIVDDDPSVCRALTRLFASAGFQAEGYASAREFLAAKNHVPAPSCLVLDLKMPGLDGLQLQEKLLKGDYCLPIVFITGYGDIPSTVRAMKNGAVTFLSKPLDANTLIEAVQEGMTKDASRKRDIAEHKAIARRLCLLSEREHEILTYVIAGMLNKQIASALNISEKTVKAHRGRMMGKMQAGSVAQLVRMAQKAGISPAGNA